MYKLTKNINIKGYNLHIPTILQVEENTKEVKAKAQINIMIVNLIINKKLMKKVK